MQAALKSLQLQIIDQKNRPIVHKLADNVNKPLSQDSVMHIKRISNTSAQVSCDKIKFQVIEVVSLAHFCFACRGWIHCSTFFCRLAFYRLSYFKIMNSIPLVLFTYATADRKSGKRSYLISCLCKYQLSVITVLLS